MRVLRHPVRAFFALAIAVSALFVSIPSVFAEAPSVPPVTYVDESGAVQSIEGYTSVTAETSSLDAGWYVVDQDVAVDGVLTVNGDVKLVLSDGCTLVATQGVHVPQGSSLTLLGQESSSGSLEAGDPGITSAGQSDALKVALCVEVVAADGTPRIDTAHTPEVSTTVTAGPVVVRPVTTHILEARNAGERVYYACQTCGDLFDDEDAWIRLPEEPVVAAQEEKGAKDTEDDKESAAKEEASAPAATPTEEEQTVTVSFDANGGTGTMDPMEVGVDVSFVLPECSFTAPEGKEFDRWNLGVPGSSVSVDAPTTAVAQWKDASSGIPTTTDDGASSSTSTPTSTATETPTSTSPDTSDASTPSVFVTLLALSGIAVWGFGARMGRQE